MKFWSSADFLYSDFSMWLQIVWFCSSFLKLYWVLDQGWFQTRTMAGNTTTLLRGPCFVWKMKVHMRHTYFPCLWNVSTYAKNVHCELYSPIKSTLRCKSMHWKYLHPSYNNDFCYVWHCSLNVLITWNGCQR